MKIRLILAFLIIIAALVRLPFLQREFTLEEALHVRVARAVSQAGYPFIYYSELAKDGIFLDRTPAFFLFFAPSLKLLGESEFTIRLVPLIFALLELVIIFHFTRKLFIKSTPMAIIASLLFTTHPYVIQTSLMVHFDNAIFTFFITFFLFLALKKISNRKNSLKDHLQLALLFLITFAIKYEAAIMALAVVLIYSLIFYRQFFQKLIPMSLAAILLFQLVFLFYNAIFGHPELFVMPIGRILWVIQNIFIPKATIEITAQTRSLWADNYYLLIRFLSWLSIPAIVLTFYSLVRIFTQKNLRQDPKIIFLLIWFGLFVLTYLLGGWAGDYPRYFVSAMPPLFTLAGIAITSDAQILLQKIPFRQILLFLICGLLIFLFFLQKNLLFLDHITGWIPSLQIPFFSTLAIASAIIATFALKKRQFWLLPVILTLYLGQIILQFNHDLKSDFSLTNFYGASHFKDSGLYLKQVLDPTRPILTIDPIAYYWGSQFYDYFQFGVQDQNPELILKQLKDGEVQAIALPASLIPELSATAQKYDLNLEQIMRSRFTNHYQSKGQNGVAIYF